MSQLTQLLTDLHRRGGSDLILKEGRPPLMRISGQLLPSDHPVQTKERLWQNVAPLLDEGWVKRLEREREVDLSFEIEDVARFRVNVFYQRNRVGAVIRSIPLETPTVDALKLPPVLKDLAGAPHGIILVTGPTGSGKSTTLAAIVEHINETRHAHIITIEDPVEFVYTDRKATITQRGIGEDVLDTSRALRAALRQNPDVILAGEMRDRETMELALHAAGTGHLVLSTLHTNDAKQSITRITDAFPADGRQGLLRTLSVCLRGVVSQRLIRRADGTGRVAAFEVMVCSPTIKQLIEKGAIDDMARAIESSSSYYRMLSFNQALVELVNRRLITPEAALENSASPGDLKLMLKGMQRGGATALLGRKDVELRRADPGATTNVTSSAAINLADSGEVAPPPAAPTPPPGGAAPRPGAGRRRPGLGRGCRPGPGRARCGRCPGPPPGGW
ncbi:MAG: PilT/PilU family type 4a pilus ATPase [Planctomycetes bacterium]|nr:PilT/PilU family type 4a pilus ATPase [Planctomycetota bacterium]